MVAYVVDASVVISRFVKEADTEYAVRLFNRLKTGDILYVPEFCRLECVNVLWKHVRFQGVLREQAIQAVQDLVALPLTIVPVDSFLERALNIGLDHQLAMYDSVYIALAENLSCSLVTLDEPQRRAATQHGVTSKPIQDF